MRILIKTIKFIRLILKRVIMTCLGLSVRDEIPCIWKTLLFNYVAFGCKGLAKQPVIVYRNTKIFKIGKILIHCKLRRGILTIGKLDYKSQGETRFYNAGTINIYGPVRIEGATIIENFGDIIFEGHDLISDGSTILVRSSLTIGKYSWLGFHSLIMDSDDHYTIDTVNLHIERNTMPIRIGAYNWFGNSTIIKKGVVTPDYIIVASANTILTKDYSALQPYSVLGGIPAKVIKTGIRCVFNEENEKNIKSFFFFYPQVIKYILDEQCDLDSYCSSSKNPQIL